MYRNINTTMNILYICMYRIPKHIQACMYPYIAKLKFKLMLQRKVAPWGVPAVLLRPRRDLALFLLALSAVSLFFSLHLDLVEGFLNNHSEAVGT